MEPKDELRSLKEKGYLLSKERDILEGQITQAKIALEQVKQRLFKVYEEEEAIVKAEKKGPEITRMEVERKTKEEPDGPPTQ